MLLQMAIFRVLQMAMTRLQRRLYRVSCLPLAMPPRLIISYAILPFRHVMWV
jgi:hypothetical protein